jgi:hypothetical protein
MTAAPLSADEEKNLLESQRSWLQAQLDSIAQRLQELGKGRETE